MPRGNKGGTIRHVSEVSDPSGRVLQREHWIARKRYTDLKGRAREKKSVVYSVTQAERALRKIEREIEDELAGVPVPDRRRTVSDLIAYCKQHHFKPAQYAGEKKVAGQRTWRATWNALKPVEKFFGRMAAVEVDGKDLEDYKEQRLRTPVAITRVRREGKRRVVYTERRPRSLASVDRELAWLRRVFSIAVRMKWLAENPFKRADKLIEQSAETKRLRILSFDEERRLFAVLTPDKKRGHLPLAITMALETAMRKGEQFRLERNDVDLDGRLMSALSYKGKRTVRRPVPITDLLLPALVDHLASHDGAKVFSIVDPKKAFANSCRDAGIEGVTWHSLRHTAITRMVHVYKIPPLDVMKVSGHSVWKTFFETYVNLDGDMVRSIGAAIDSARAALPPQPAHTQNILSESDAIN